MSDIGSAIRSSLQSFESHPAVSFLNRDGLTDLSGAALLLRSESAAEILMQTFYPGQRLLISGAPGPDRTILLLAAWMADLVPAVVDVEYPTDACGLERLRKSRLLTDGNTMLLVQEPFDWMPEACDSSSDRVSFPVMEGNRFLMIGNHLESAESTEDAYVQYSSGTTGAAKGVRLSATAILSCIRAMSIAYQLVPDDVVINPLPLSHDFGLFGGLLTPLLKGSTSVQIAPELWSRNPTILLRAITDRRGTICYLPNSGFELCSRFVRSSALPELDLSSIKFWMNASEPIIPGTRRRFLERFRSCGVRQSMLSTGYGMAENTLAVTFSGIGQEVPTDFIDAEQLQRDRLAEPVPGSDGSGIPIVACGRPFPGVEVSIRDEQGEALPERHVGQIAVQSDSLFSGYLGDPEGTADCMKDGWFMTGDLGYLFEGQLYFTGRSKDLIIVGGRNIHPDEIEKAVVEALDILPTEVAAFGLLDESKGTERLIIVVVATGERRRKWTIVEQQIRKQIRDAAGVVPDRILAVRRGWIQRTGNGKRDRNAMRDRYLRENKQTSTISNRQP